METKKMIHDIGKLEGKILAFGGVYSNLQALEKIHHIANDLAIPSRNVICTGDIVGYCAQPEECVQLVRDWDIHTIAGNVEIQLREGQDDCGCDFKTGGRCDTFSRQWYPYAKKQLSDDSIEWMKSLPNFISFELAEMKGVVVHGSWHETSEYIFKSTKWPVKQKNFAHSKSDLILAGHCGLPFNHIKEKKYWINPGVIGMPANDGTPRVWYMILEPMKYGRLNFSHHSFEYDVQKAAGMMEKENLPFAYASTLKTGIWDNCEILPEQETHLQGTKLEKIHLETTLKSS